METVPCVCCSISCQAERVRSEPLGQQDYRFCGRDEWVAMPVPSSGVAAIPVWQMRPPLVLMSVRRLLLAVLHPPVRLVVPSAPLSRTVTRMGALQPLTAGRMLSGQTATDSCYQLELLEAHSLRHLSSAAVLYTLLLAVVTCYSRLRQRWGTTFHFVQ